MFWDNETKPALAALLGDLFGTAFGLSPAFENAYQTNAEGRSYSIAMPMPSRKGARIVITHDGEITQPQIDWEDDWEDWRTPPPPGTLYLHAHWHSAKPPLDQDFEILPHVTGQGRYLGAVIGIHGDPAYTLPGHPRDPGSFWWGEGEVRMFLGGDGGKTGPTLAGTGAEDYLGTAYGLGKFTTMEAGCTVANADLQLWSCYRFHTPDPVYFHSELRVAVQQIGGAPLAEARLLQKTGAAMEPVGVDRECFTRLLDWASQPALPDASFRQGWVLYRRFDDWCATAFFYLDTPTDNLPQLQPVGQRSAP